MKNATQRDTLMPQYFHKPSVLDLSPAYFQVVSPEEFIQIYETKRNEIQSVQVIPPQVGSGSFGQILIRWKRPIYTVRSLPGKVNE
jgi:hypothetical protein